MNHLTRTDYASALRLLARLEEESADPASFARASVTAVNEFVSSEFTMLSVCDLVHADDDRRGGLDYAIAVPLHVDGHALVSIVLTRRGFDFSERERERLELLRPHLAFMYRQMCLANASPFALPPSGPAPAPADAKPESLTPREGEVMHWLSRGKTDADIAALLAISPRTVHKHLEHIYVKLGVETRTAAVMRAFATRAAATHTRPGSAPRRKRPARSARRA